MAPARILIIRHAERPDPQYGMLGVDAHGSTDERSLSVRGWQRAGALARLFCPRDEPELSGIVPDAVFAAGIGPESESRRPQQTVTALLPLLRQLRPRLAYVTEYLNHQTEGLAADMMRRDGILLVCWQHKHIPDVVKALPEPPRVPPAWPPDRFDMIWILDREADGWVFRQMPQMLLAGDSDGFIV